MKYRDGIKITLGCLLALGMLLPAVPSIYGQDITDIQNQIDQTNQQIVSLQSDIGSLQNQAQGYLADQGNVQVSLSHVQSLLSQAEAKENTITKLIASLSTLKAAAEIQVQEKTAVKDTALKALYELSQQNTALLFISSSNATNFLLNMAFNESNIGDQQTQIAALTEQIQSLQDSINQEDTEKAKQDMQVQEFKKEKQELQTKLTALENSYATTNSKVSNETEQVVSLRKQYSNLTAQEQSIIAAKLAASGATTQTAGASSPGNTSSGYTPSGSPGTFQIKINGQAISSSLPGSVELVPDSINDYATVKGGSNSGYYTGNLEFRTNTDVNFIEQVSLENYIKGIGEMPSSWNMQALDTQAIAARTYALYNKGDNAAKGYDINNTTAYQAYDGYGKEAEQGNGTIDTSNPQNGTMYQAGQNTSGQVLLYNGKFADTLYSANNGGYERSDKEIWGGGSYPYLASQSDNGGSTQYDDYNDPSSVCPSEFLSSASATAVSLNSGVGSFTDLSGIAVYLMQGHGITNLNPQTDYSSYVTNAIGTFSSAKITYSNGRTTTSTMSSASQESTLISGNGNTDYVSDVTLYGSKASIDIPLIPANNSAYAPWDTGIFNYFYAAYMLASPGNDVFNTPSWFFTYSGGNTVSFYSFGYGHSIGMSQCGAEGRAAAGQSDSSILSAYYPGTSLTTDSQVQNANPENCKNLGVNYPTNDACIRIGIEGYSGSDNIVTEHASYTIYIGTNYSQMYHGSAGDTIEVIQN